jgi:hypothetical protein
MEISVQELNLILTAIKCYLVCGFEPQCVEMQEEAMREKKQIIALRDRIEGVLCCAQDQM